MATNMGVGTEIIRMQRSSMIKLRYITENFNKNRDLVAILHPLVVLLVKKVGGVIQCADMLKAKR